ncbi:MAG: polysaccharide biosynthesis/export family protein [Cytophagales bacterium]
MHIKTILVSFVLFLSLFSCTSHKKIPYFKNLNGSLTPTNLPTSVFSEPTIQPDDILAVHIQTIDPQTALITNQTTGSQQSIGSSSNNSIGQQTVTGYTVDKEGNVELPMLGKINVIGKTTANIKETIRLQATKFYKEPSVSVKLQNFKVTVLGEVAKPGTYSFANEKVSLIDALGICGDLTIYGKRENLLLIRTTNGTKEYVRINLNDSEVFSSSYFYLKSNDVLYIEPNKAKIAANNTVRTQNITIAAAVISLLIVVFTRVNFN